MSHYFSKATLLLAEALMVSPAEINADTALGHTPQWDSLAHMRLILSLEDNIGSYLPPEAIVSISNLADVSALLN